MKRGLNPDRIALAVASIIIILSIFAAVLILSGRTVLVSGNYIQAVHPEYPSELPMITEESPCEILKCRQGTEPTFLGYEESIATETHALCVCATTLGERAYYNDFEIKRIRTKRKY